MPEPIRIVFALYPGVTHLDFTGPHQFFSRLQNAEVMVASVGGANVESDGLTFTGLTALADIKRCEVLCIPGGPGVIDAIGDDSFMDEIRRLGSGARFLTSVCTGSVALGAAGFLKGRRAACHWAWRELLEPFGAVVDEARVARDGNIITGGGVTAGIDFALALIAELAGPETAQAIQLGLEYAPAPPFVGGRPELAPPMVTEAVRARMSDMAPHRRAAVEQAAAKLKELAA
ncbi:MAG TPA: DJ-1/PfpI family protein [Caulobacteraceae bacterium]|nr:DJ-1/PfpI family protein [Caulobacteraceae bacterium]